VENCGLEGLRWSDHQQTLVPGARKEVEGRIREGKDNSKVIADNSCGLGLLASRKRTDERAVKTKPA